MTKHTTAKRKLADVDDERILTTAQLLERIPLTRQSIWRLSREGKFPKPINITNSRIGWRLSSVLLWLREREKKPLERRPYFVNKDKPHEAA